MDNSPRIGRILLTAFDAYADGGNIYRQNASRLALEYLLLQPPQGVLLETRIYPVEFGSIRERVERDIACGFDAVILTGQAPSSDFIRLEMRAKNIGRDPNGFSGQFPLALDGPASLAATIDWAKILAATSGGGTRVAISDDVGDYLCNAALYFAILAAERRWKSGAGDFLTRVGFIHVPLAPSQVSAGSASMPTEETADRLKEIIEALVRLQKARVAGATATT